MSKELEIQQNVKQYPYSVKIEDTRAGPMVTVHVWSEGYTQVKDEAIRIYWATREDLKKGTIKSVSPDDYENPGAEAEKPQ